MSRINLVIVITTIVLLNSCMTFDGFNENGTLYENNQSGIYLKLFPDSTFNFLQRNPRDTSYGSWTISEEKYLMLNSPHSVISLPMSVNESSQNENHDTLYFCIYDMNGEVIKKEDIHYVIIINDLDTIWEMQSHEIIMNNYHSKIEHLQVAIIDIDPPYTAFNLPTNGDLIYERYSPSSSQSNQFIFKIYYMPYLWNYIGLENERVRFRRKKLILMNNTKLYQK